MRIKRQVRNGGPRDVEGEDVIALDEIPTKEEPGQREHAMKVKLACQGTANA